MPIDLKRLSVEELNALKNRDLSGLSSETLAALREDAASSAAASDQVKPKIGSVTLADKGGISESEMPQFVPAPGGIFGVTPIGAGAREAMATFTETVPPAVAAIGLLAPEVTIPAVAGVATIGALSKLAAEATRGKDPFTTEPISEAAQAAFLSSYPGPIQGSRFLMGRQGGVAKGLEALGMTGLTYRAGEETKAAIQGKQAPSLRETWRDAMLPSIFSGALHTTATATGRIADLVDEANKRREILAEIGVKNPTLAALLGTKKFGSIEAGVASTDQQLANRIAGMGEDVQNYISNAFRRGVFASNEEIADKVNREIAKYGDVQKRFDLATKQYDEASAALDAAQRATNLAPEERQKLIQDATEKVYRSIQDRAAALMEQSATGGIGLVLKDVKSDQVSSVFSDLWKLRSSVGKDLYEPLNNLGALFSANDLADVAKRALGNYASTEEGARLINAIRSYKGAGQTVEGVRLNPEARFDPTAPLTLPAKTGLDLEDVRQMREHLSDIIDQMNVGGVKSIERNASKAYSAITERIGEIIKAQPNGTELSSQWEKARSYWASTYRALENDDRAARMLIRGRASAEDIDAMASKLLDGNAQTVSSINDFVKAVSNSDPQQAKLVLNSIGSAVQNSILYRFQNANGVVDWAKATPAVLKMANLRGMQEVFPVEMLGMGSIDQLKSWGKAMADFQSRGLTSDRINEALNNPVFQQAIVEGSAQSVSDAARRAFAEQLFKQRVIEAEGNMLAGATAVAQRKQKEAQAVLQNAKIGKDEAERLLAEARNDPAFLMLSGQSELTRVPEATSGRIGDLILKQDRGVARAWMDGLRKSNPELADQVSSNVLANYIKEFVSAARSGNVDIPRLRASLTAKNGNYEKLADVLGDEVAGKANKLISSLPIIDDVMGAKAVTDSSLKQIANIFGIGLGVIKAVPAGQLPKEQFAQRRFVTQIGDLIANDMYHTLAVYFTDPKRAAILAQSRSLSDALNQLPLQQGLSLMSNKYVVEENARRESKRSQPTP